MLFTASILALTFALQHNNLLTLEKGMLSLIGLLPAIAGIVAGQRIRKKISKQYFKKIFFSSLLLLGIYVVLSSTFFNPPH